LECILHGRNEYSTGKYQLLDTDSGRQDQNERKILQTAIPGSWTIKVLYRKSQLLYKFKYENVTKMKNKFGPVLSNEIKKDTKISWDYTFKIISITFFFIWNFLLKMLIILEVMLH
jgi:hypothetical protein